MLAFPRLSPADKSPTDTVSVRDLTGDLPAHHSHCIHCMYVYMLSINDVVICMFCSKPLV